MGYSPAAICMILCNRSTLPQGMLGTSIRCLMGRIDLVLAGYNAGENAVINSGYKVPPYRETRSYVARGVSDFRRIAQSNILSLERRLQIETPVKQASSFADTSPLPYRPAPTGTQSTRSIYFPH
jgi:hypothetical protein